MTDREELVRRGLRLNYITISYNVFEAAGSLVAGVMAGSVALVGFGLDSCIEVTASLAARWRLRLDKHSGKRRDDAERRTSHIIGASFIALGAYIIMDSARALLHHEEPDRSVFGIVVLMLSCIIMPVLGAAKRKVAAGLNSAALRSESRQTDLCAYLSYIALTGILLDALLGWWWADPVAALLMVPIIAKEGIEGITR